MFCKRRKARNEARSRSSHIAAAAFDKVQKEQARLSGSYVHKLVCVTLNITGTLKAFLKQVLS